MNYNLGFINILSQVRTVRSRIHIDRQEHMKADITPGVLFTMRQVRLLCFERDTALYYPIAGMQQWNGPVPEDGTRLSEITIREYHRSTFRNDRTGRPAIRPEPTGYGRFRV